MQACADENTWSGKWVNQYGLEPEYVISFDA